MEPKNSITITDREEIKLIMEYRRAAQKRILLNLLGKILTCIASNEIPNNSYILNNEEYELLMNPNTNFYLQFICTLDKVGFENTRIEKDRLCWSSFNLI